MSTAPRIGSRRLRALVVAAATAVLLAACGPAAPDASPSDVEDATPATIKVGVLPIANYAPLWIAINEGLFEAENLTVEPVLATAGPANIAALIAGGVDIASSDSASFSVAVAQGLPLQMLPAGGTTAPTDSDKPSGSPIAVLENSDIESAEDLVGKTIAVNVLGGIVEVTTRAGLENEGVDPDSVDFVEIPFPEMPAALAAGQVDAAAMAEPFFTLALGQGARFLFDGFYAAGPGIPTGGWLVTEQWVADNPGVAARFAAAIKKANDLAQGDTELVRETVAGYTTIPPEVLEKVNFSDWVSVTDVDGLQEMADITRKFGPPDLAEVNMADHVVDLG